MVRLRPFYMNLGWNLVCLGCGDGSAGCCVRIAIYTPFFSLTASYIAEPASRQAHGCLMEIAA